MDNITVKEEKFIRIIGEAAREDWQARHMCLLLRLMPCVEKTMRI